MMPGMGWVIGVVAVVVMVATYLTFTAKRVDRLHQRAASAGRALDAQLVRRAATAAVLAEEEGPNPDLYAAARAALDSRAEEREAAENDLTRMLRKLQFDQSDPTDVAIIAASRRVALSRQVHTDFVRDALAVRSRPLVRAMRMARKHPAPAYFDIDDPTLASVS
jgi:Tfp pilus assembly protein PilX